MSGYTIFDLYTATRIKIIYADENEVKFDDGTFIGDDPIFDKDRYIPVVDQNGMSLLVMAYTRVDGKHIAVYLYEEKEFLYTLVDYDEITVSDLKGASDLIECMLYEIQITHEIYIDKTASWNETVKMILDSWEASGYYHSNSEALEKLKTML
ncbi:hypothetical protein [Amedibacillus sp. YH-ame6]